MLEHFKFLKANAKVTPKMTIPAPGAIHFRGAAGDSKEAYPEMDAYFDDLARSTEGDEGLLQRRLPLPAARRHLLGLSLLQRSAGRRARAARMPTG